MNNETRLVEDAYASMYEANEKTIKITDNSGTISAIDVEVRQIPELSYKTRKSGKTETITITGDEKVLNKFIKKFDLEKLIK